MEDNNNTIFTWPEGWKEAYESLDFLPEEMREGFLAAMIDTLVGM
jgi:hypothetical protein